VGSGWLAIETGEHEEERASRVVAESTIEDHEESAERFLILAGIVLPLAAAGLLSHPIGAAARALTVVASIGVAVAVADVGHQGGELVYKHGAARAYAEAGAGPVAAAWGGDHDDDHDDD
jgi:hypothetical protein